MKKIDLVGMIFGRLTVIGPHESKNGRTMWECQCECGNTIVARSENLKSGNTKSCGCLVSDTSSAWLKSLKTTHGLSKTRLYVVWKNMISRCYDERNKRYDRYGGRGISVCDEWLNSLENFVNWANSNGYDDALTIDRIDTNGNYCPDNCRWVDAKVQCNNRSTNVLIEYNGELLTRREIADIENIGYGAVRYRYG